MGKKGKWFGAVKKVFSPDKKSVKSKKGEFSETQDSDPHTTNSTVEVAAPVRVPTPVPAPVVAQPAEEIGLDGHENEESRHAVSVALATAAAAEAAVAAAHAAAEVVRLAASSKYAGKSREAVAAIKIQTAFRGYLARRALRALRGLVRLKSLLHGNAVKRQATTTLRSMQTLARVQSHIRSRRIRMSEENQALQRQLLLKRDRELEKLRMGEEWVDSLQSKEQIEEKLVSKQEAAVRRERALAYAFSHQWKSSSRSATPLFMDPNNPHWGWSWLERWMATRPWDSKSTTIDKAPNSDLASVKSSTHSNGGEFSSAYSRRDSVSPATQKLSRMPSSQSPATPPSRAVSIPTKTKSQLEDDSRSVLSMQSERPRRHSLGGSSIRDDESLASSSSVRSYMAPTQSARAKTRFQSPSLVENIGTPGRGSADSVKKRLSFPVADKQMRRHSGPPKVSVTPVKEIAVEANGRSM